MGKQWQTIFLGSKITADGDCIHEIKRCLLLGRKAMTNLDSILKSRDITLPTKVCLIKAMVFLVVMYGFELDYKESWVPKNWCFWTVVLEKTLESPLDFKEIQPVHPKGNQSWIFIGRIDVEVKTPILCCRKRDPFQGPKLGSCLAFRNELSEETHVLTKQEILLGKGTRAESSRVREARRTVLPRGSQSRVLWW